MDDSPPANEFYRPAYQHFLQGLAAQHPAAADRGPDADRGRDHARHDRRDLPGQLRRRCWRRPVPGRRCTRPRRHRGRARRRTATAGAALPTAAEGTETHEVRVRGAGHRPPAVAAAVRPRPARARRARRRRRHDHRRRLLGALEGQRRLPDLRAEPGAGSATASRTPTSPCCRYGPRWCSTRCSTGSCSPSSTTRCRCGGERGGRDRLRRPAVLLRGGGDRRPGRHRADRQLPPVRRPGLGRVQPAGRCGPAGWSAPAGRTA